MFNMSSNISGVVSQLTHAGTGVQNAVGGALEENAKQFLKACVDEIDRQIYSAPKRDYKRTKFLRRSHHIKKLAWHTWLIWNDAEYAGPVHYGYHTRGGSFIAGKPWMQIAIDGGRQASRERLRKAGYGALSGAAGGST